MTYNILDWVDDVPGQQDINGHFSVYWAGPRTWILVHWCTQDITVWDSKEELATEASTLVADDTWHFYELLPEEETV